MFVAVLDVAVVDGGDVVSRAVDALVDALEQPLMRAAQRSAARGIAARPAVPCPAARSTSQDASPHSGGNLMLRAARSSP
jgi:hypothetical protein